MTFFKSQNYSSRRIKDWSYIWAQGVCILHEEDVHEIVKESLNGCVTAICFREERRKRRKIFEYIFVSQSRKEKSWLVSN